MWILSVSGIIAQIAPLLIMLRFVRSPDNANIFVVAGFASSALITIFIFALTCRSINAQAKFSSASWMKLFPMTITLGLSSLMILIYHQMDVVLIGYLRLPLRLECIPRAQQVMELGLSSSFLSETSFFQFLAKAVQDEKSEKQYLQWMLSGMATFALPVSILGMVLAKP
jgi:O-antigen/teichoic acid export membrane protein